MCVCLGLCGMVLTTETQKYLTNKLKSTEKLSISIHQHGIKLGYSWHTWAGFSISIQLVPCIAWTLVLAVGLEADMLAAVISFTRILSCVMNAKC